MSVSGGGYGGGNNANNAQSLAAEGVVERGRYVAAVKIFSFIHSSVSFTQLHMAHCNL